jgi:hypothetical protein
VLVTPPTNVGAKRVAARILTLVRVGREVALVLPRVCLQRGRQRARARGGHRQQRLGVTANRAGRPAIRADAIRVVARIPRRAPQRQRRADHGQVGRDVVDEGSQAVVPTGANHDVDERVNDEDVRPELRRHTGWRHQVVERLGQRRRPAPEVHGQLTNLRGAWADILVELLDRALACRVGIANQPRREIDLDVLHVLGGESLIIGGEGEGGDRLVWVGAGLGRGGPVLVGHVAREGCDSQAGHRGRSGHRSRQHEAGREGEQRHRKTPPTAVLGVIDARV